MKTFLRQMGALIRLSFLELWRRNDVFGLLIFALAVMVPLAMATPFGATGASRYLDEAALLLIWGFSLFIALGTGARLFPPEFASRTIYPLLAKPISRTRLLMGKYLGAVAAAASALTLFYLLFALSVGLRGGGWFGEGLLQAFTLHLAFVAVAVALALLGSLVLTVSASHALCGIVLLAMFFFGRKLPQFADATAAPVVWIVRVAYAIAPHVEFFDMRQRVIHGWGCVDSLVFIAVLGYAVTYVAALLALAAGVLKRKRL